MLVIGSDDYRDSPLLSQRERAAVLWAEHVARNTARERDDVLTELRRHFSDAEIVELTGACGTFASSNRFQDSMGIPLEPPREIDKIRNSLRVDAVRLKAYIGQLLDEWPSSFPTPAPYASPAPSSMHSSASGAPEAQIPSPLPRPPAPPSTTAAKPIPLLDASQARGEAQVFIRASDAMLGGRTNATLMWAHIPYIAKLWPPYQLVMEREGLGGVLPTVLKMYVLVRTAHLNRATYSLAHRTALARAAGVPQTQLHALTLPDCEHAATFSERERVMLRWVDEVATNMAKRRADLFDALSRHFTDVELVELTGLCAMANQVDLTLNALRVPLESATEIERVNHSPRIEAARVKAYLATIYAHWPDTFPTPHR